MKKYARNVWHKIFTIVLFALFFQVPIFYGLVKLSIVSCNVMPTLGSIHTFSPRRVGTTTPVHDATPDLHSGTGQKRDIKGSHLNQASANATAVNSIPASAKMQNLSQLRPHGHAHFTFVQFSSYRESPRVFFVVGVTSVVVREFDLPVYKCEWHPKPNRGEPLQPSKVTDAKMIYVYFDQMPRIYVVAIVNCTFEDDVGMGEEGGSLFMTVSAGPHPGDTEKVLVLQEQNDEAKEAMRKRDQPLPFKYAFCGPPMHGNVKAEWVLQWLVYHHYLWRDSVHFFFYNVGGITNSVRQVFSPFINNGLLTIVDVEDQKDYPSWYFNQLLFINDCLHRTRYLSSWTFFHDFDEFFTMSSSITLDKLLDEYKDVPYLTFGSLRASLWICTDVHPESSEWPLQRMRWAEKQPFCSAPDQDPWICIHGKGARKYVVNPRKVFAGGVHRTAIPEEGGVNLNASIARLNHYPGMLANGTTSCSFTVNVSIPIELLYQYAPSSQLYERDDSIPIQMGKAREFDAELLAAYL
ncbi:hypothetical protein O6H91_12G092000 [Diphasiastrum complanatum]|uniref:Uncharacterized protein n=1 Tax=Diphasiastrum complanatum TaxID=34168 RepID=A0ACC2C4Q3_DIPCM|nr:hypothetical protein O6H91_12G092000 [Diphasiastrum complanatum]